MNSLSWLGLAPRHKRECPLPSRYVQTALRPRLHFIEQKQLDASAARLAMQLARKLDGNLPWTPANAPAHAARVISRGSERCGATLLTWSNTPKGAAVSVYALEAPADVYRTSADTFARVLESFLGVGDVMDKQAGARAGAGPAAFVSWTDPNEGEFTIQVP